MGSCFNTMSNQTAQSSNGKIKHKVVVVGASFGGQGFVHGLLLEDGQISQMTSTLAKEHVSVQLLDCRDSMYISGALQYVWTNRMAKNKLVHPMSKTICDSLPGVTFRKGKKKGAVSSINIENKSITLEDGNDLNYDTLVLSPGVISDPKPIPGLKESGAIDVCVWEDVDRFKAEIKSIISLAALASKPINVVMSVTKMPYKCPPLPFEVISLVDNQLRSAGVRSSCHLYLTVPNAFPFGGPSAAKEFTAALKEMDIECLDHHTITSVEKMEGGKDNSLSSSSILKFKIKDEMKSLEADAFFCIYPQRPPDFIKSTGLTNKMGFIPVDLQTNKAEGAEDIYVIGDCCHTTFPAVGKPHPKAGQFAYDMGVAVGKIVKSKVISPESTTPIPTSRVGICAAECGLGNKGILVEPNFSACLQNPKEGKPNFGLEHTHHASERKAQWINEFLETFFGKGNYTSMV